MRAVTLWDAMLDNLLDDWSVTAYSSGDFYDVLDERDETTIKLAVPGIRKEDLKIEVGRGGKGPVIVKGKTDQYSVDRRILLPKGVDPENVEACLENGILTLKLRKKPAEKPVLVPVK